MNNFLESIAEAYLVNEANRLSEYCFVFPSKRSALFFREAMRRKASEAGVKALLMPKTVTVVDFMDSFCPTVRADRTEMIFILFDCYRKVVARRKGKDVADAISFTKFVPWAETALNDFDDVDRAVADPQQIFHNVAQLREIATNYLTPEQIEVISHYWNIDGLIDGDLVSNPDARMWRNSTEAAKNFMRLWQVMADVYELFVSAMRERGLHSDGMAFRIASEAIANSYPDDMPYSRYVFVGFNLLSAAEEKIFAMLLNKRREGATHPMADFYWDFASPVFSHEQAPKGTSTYRRYKQKYPSFYDCVEPIANFPKVRVYGIPSRAGEAKCCASVLAAMFPTGEQPPTEQQLLKTAIVLPEEKLLTPLITSIPTNIGALNLTMGFKLRNTAVASLIRDIVSMQMRATHSPDRNTFFIDDVMTVLANPLVRSVYTLESMELLSELQQSRIFNVPELFFEATPFAPLFRMVVIKEDVNAVLDYLENLLKWVFTTLENAHRYDENTAGSEYDDLLEGIKIYVDNWHQGKDSKKVPPDVSLQCTFIVRYLISVRRIRALMLRYLGEHPATVDNATVINMVEKIMGQESVSFEGEPLRGLQVMGVLETRALDFDNIIIPSMNDGVFPRTRKKPSFIPNALRKAYGLMTPQDDENNYTYFFYRMISRAKQVFLIYDARTVGVKKRPQSRFIRQLEHIYRPKGLEMNVLSYGVDSPDDRSFVVEKTPEIQHKIKQYFIDGSNRALSPSGIKQMLKCPMAFYLEKICHYKREDEVREWMDESTYGTILHKVFETLYNDLKRQYGSMQGVAITADMLEGVLKSPTLIAGYIADAIKTEYLKLKSEHPRYSAPLHGDALIYANTFELYVRTILEREKKLAPFNYLQSEFKIANLHLRVRGTNGNEIRFNFNGVIDRIDKVRLPDGTETLRVVDYKTGSDELTYPGFEQVFNNHEHQALLQLLLYCQAYAQMNNLPDEPIQPMIYQIRSLMTNDITPLTGPQPLALDLVDKCDIKQPSSPRSAKWKIFDYHDYLNPINDMLIQRLEELLDPSIPFTCTDDVMMCKRCAFAPICNREQ